MSKNSKSNLRPIMFVGTGSDVGKSVINAAFCRIFLQDGYQPAPFKAQNMSLNSYATLEGLEIGRAQAVQAEACGIDCSVDMNPVLLKPTSNMSSQVVLNGKPIGNKSAKEYFLKTNRDHLFDEAFAAFKRLEEQYNPIVVEGAGSISEVNLWDKDITNMRIALAGKADTYLIADIDKGGVFGSVFGTIQLLPKAERALIKGIIINKFRGDIELFEEGRKILEDLTGIPVVSVIPYFRDIFIEEEDAVVLEKKMANSSKTKVNIAVVLLKHMSNFTDFNVLERVPEVQLFYSHDADEIENADIVIIPGSKNTIADLQFLRKTGMAKAILNAKAKGKSVYGICGGFQMMGTEIHDPNHVEGHLDAVPGLALLPVITHMNEDKVTVQSDFTFKGDSEISKGYQIHMGETQSELSSPVCHLQNGEDDGYFLDDKTWGTYIHGIFDNMSIVKTICKHAGLEHIEDFNVVDFKEEQYNKLAKLVRDSSDMDYIYKLLKR